MLLKAWWATWICRTLPSYTCHIGLDFIPWTWVPTCSVKHLEKQLYGQRRILLYRSTFRRTESRVTSHVSASFVTSDVSKARYTDNHDVSSQPKACRFRSNATQATQSILRTKSLGVAPGSVKKVKDRLFRSHIHRNPRIIRLSPSLVWVNTLQA